MLLEDLTQKELNRLVACAKQRSVLAAIISGVMQLPLTSKEGLAIKTTMMASFSQGLDMGIHVGDEIDLHMLHSMKDHCSEQIAMEDLLDTL